MNKDMCIDMDNKNHPVTMQPPSVHLQDLYPEFVVMVDEEIRDKVRGPTFTTRERIYRQLRRTIRYKRPDGFGTARRRKIKINGRPIRLEETFELAKRLHLSMKELERHVTYVQNGISINSKKMFCGFPIKANKDHAFLIGLFHATGGFSFNEDDRGLRYNVDMGTTLEMKIIGERLGESARVNICESRKVKSSSGQLYWKKRCVVSFSKFMENILVKLGLERPPESPYKGHLGQKFGYSHGRVMALRERKCTIPRWILKDGQFLHAYVEGYINSVKMQSYLYGGKDTNGKHRFLGQMLLRFSGVDKRSLKKRTRIVIAHLESCGVKGHLRQIHPTSSKTLTHYEFVIFNREALRNLSLKFKIYSTYSAARLAAINKAIEDPLVLHALSQCDTDSSLILGALLLTSPISIKELRTHYRLDSPTLSKALVNLERLGLIKKELGKRDVCSFDSRVFRENLISHSQEEIRRAEDYVKEMSCKILYRCSICKAICTSPTHCGASSEPISRRYVLAPIMGQRTRLQGRIANVASR